LFSAKTSTRNLRIKSNGPFPYIPDRRPAARSVRLKLKTLAHTKTSGIDDRTAKDQDSAKLLQSCRGRPLRPSHSQANLDLGGVAALLAFKRLTDVWLRPVSGVYERHDIEVVLPVAVQAKERDRVIVFNEVGEVLLIDAKKNSRRVNPGRKKTLSDLSTSNGSAKAVRGANCLLRYREQGGSYRPADRQKRATLKCLQIQHYHATIGPPG